MFRVIFCILLVQVIAFPFRFDDTLRLSSPAIANSNLGTSRISSLTIHPHLASEQLPSPICSRNATRNRNRYLRNSLAVFRLSPALSSTKVQQSKGLVIMIEVGDTQMRHQSACLLDRLPARPDSSRTTGGRLFCWGSRYMHVPHRHIARMRGSAAGALETSPPTNDRPRALC